MEKALIDPLNCMAFLLRTPMAWGPAPALMLAEYIADEKRNCLTLVIPAKISATVCFLPVVDLKVMSIQASP